jgi:hypothetical protein
MFTVPPGFHERLENEIQASIQSMRTAAESSREYRIGYLSALRWAQACGEINGAATYIWACACWDKMREERLS